MRPKAVPVSEGTLTLQCPMESESVELFLYKKTGHKIIFTVNLLFSNSFNIES
jgi:hypothetical protein